MEKIILIMLFKEHFESKKGNKYVIKMKKGLQ